MKAAVFDYVRPDDLEHALHLLAQHGGDAKLIAGGQSLVPMMAMRLARPAVLVDIARLDQLKRIEPRSGAITMGATVRQCEVERDTTLHASLPLLPQALRWIGHVQTRNRGTVGGSLAFADPSAELPLAALVLDATIRLRSLAGGERDVPASEFFLGPMYTAVGETDCVTGIDWPVWAGEGVRAAFEETSIRHGDFAMASAACQLQFDADGVCRRAALGLGGVSGTPLAFPDLAAQLVGEQADSGRFQEVAHAAAAHTDPGSDLHADADYRRHLAAVLLTRVLRKAATQPAHRSRNPAPSAADR